ncbi:SDR family NAD(P)-dependent oxidoreductase [Lacisediminimonas profundi]|uniref:SDR family NAD(P)-dependent oxidoreductase n=1 Tax=Lacisediminimonas profundi TaxID=2603856 RepID=UPI00124B9DC3|nr:SDR family NAD(P)-dependent oxidoreductase [Lacisediminimonas profundi]
MNPPVTSWAGRRVWIIGASSGIGAATARLLRQHGARLALSARSGAALHDIANELANDLASETATDQPHGVTILPLDVTDAAAVIEAAQTLRRLWGGIDLVLFAAGVYQPMRAQDIDPVAAGAILDTNVKGAYNVLGATVPMLRAQGQGAVALVASVAGYSGLPKALAYGPGKAALINLCEALYYDLHPAGIGVYLISPGFVATRLTAANDFTMPALITAEQAAREIVRGIEGGEFDIHFPKRFSRMLKLLRLLPYRLYFPALRRITGL